MAGRVGYAQLSNGLWLNDKACDLMDRNPRAFAMWVMSLSYASDNLTDGILTERALHRLGCDDDTRSALLDSGMWEPCDGGVCIHDYLRHNTSREQIEASRDSAAERQRRKRERGVTHDVTRDVTRDTPSDVTPHVTANLNQNQNQKENQNINNPCCCSIDDSNNARAVYEENNNNDDDSPQPSEGTTIPPDWKPDPEDARYAMLWQLDPRKTGRAFRDYHLRHGTKSHDWHATFRGWVQRNPEAKPPPDSS